jgi:DtxR family Mn-dependent transcriptional regulator
MKRKTIEEYLETIYELEEKKGEASNGDIASSLSVRPSSVTEMLRKLQANGLVRHESYGGVSLTPEGRKKASRLMETHRAVAELLGIMGVAREIAERDACEIEHHISRQSARRIGMFVDFFREMPEKRRFMSGFRQYCISSEMPLDEREAG